MELEKYLEEIDAQKQIDRLAKKCKNKKILLYGAGSYFDLIQKNYDLSKLNIAAISDKKFETTTDSNKTPYKAIKPEEMKNFDCDVIVMSLINDLSVAKSIDKNILKGSKNEKTPIIPLLSPTFSYLLKMFFKKI